MLSVVNADGSARSGPLIDEVVREGTRRMRFSRLDGTKQLIAPAEGLRECTESWADLLCGCRRRGMRDPELVVGEGAMGLGKAPAEVFPGGRHQRCWARKARNAANALPKSAQSGATKTMQEIHSAEDRAHPAKAIEACATTYGAKWPKAAQARWRAVTGAHLVALVRTGAEFQNGVRAERQAAA